MRPVFINHSSKRMPKKMITRSLHLILNQLKSQKLETKFSSKEIVIVFVNKSEMKRINFQFRKKNKITDILSFATSEEEVLGELVICPQVIAHQAKENGWTQKKEFSYMILHGILHLLGYDHQTKKQAQKMFSLQEFVFGKLKI